MLDKLPQFQLYNRQFRWNHFLLVSICSLLIDSLRVVNDEPSPYTVTAMLVPVDANIEGGDVVNYVLDYFKECHFSYESAEDIFQYLKDNLVRLTRGSKLVELINTKFRLH